MTLTDPAAAKTALRVFVRNRRKELAQEHPEAGWKVVDVAREPLARRFPDPKGKVAAVYHGLGAEIETRHLADWMVEQGWTLALPSVESPDNGDMVFRQWAPGDPLVHDQIGLNAPDPSSPALEPDLVIAPCWPSTARGGAWARAPALRPHASEPAGPPAGVRPGPGLCRPGGGRPARRAARPTAGRHPDRKRVYRGQEDWIHAFCFLRRRRRQVGPRRPGRPPAALRRQLAWSS
jgi:hypothetical protein